MGKLASIVLIVALQGCTSIELAYQTASITSGITTGKTLGEHALSTVTQADCRATNLINDRYLCEVPRTPATHYNRSPI